MKINKIQNNNTNFKMALKINPKLRADIEKRGLGYTKDLEKLGKDVKDVKLFNICYEDNLTPFCSVMHFAYMIFYKQCSACIIIDTRSSRIGNNYEVVHHTFII